MSTTYTTAEVAASYQTILQVTPPQAYVTSVTAELNNGLLTLPQFESSLLGSEQAMQSVLPALVVIDAFYQQAPSSTTLTSISAYAQHLSNLGYSDANVWSILGAQFAHNASFTQDYSGLSDLQFAQTVYQYEFGYAPTNAVAQTLASEIPQLASMFNTDDLGGKGALYGYLLWVGETSQSGKFYASANEFLTAEANAAAASGTPATYALGADILTQYPPASSAALINVSVENNVTSATEGNTVIFHVASTNVVAGTVYSYTLSGVTSGEVVGGQLSGVVTIASDGTANVPVTLNSAPGEGLSGNLTLALSLPGGIQSGSNNSAAVTLHETPAPVIDLSNSAIASATEGSTVNFHLTSSNTPVGTELNYTLSGVTANDVVGGQLSGQIFIAADGTANIPVTLVGTPGEGLNGSLTATVSLPQYASTSTSVNVASIPLVETETTYTLTNGGFATATEGSAVQFALSTNGIVPAGEQLTYTLSGVTASEVVGGLLTGTVTVGAGGTAYIPVTLVNDPGEGLSGNLTATLSLPGNANSASTASASVALIETSITAPVLSFTGPPTITIPSGTTGQATEGSTITFNVTGEHLAPGTLLNYTITGVTAAEVLGGQLTGQVTVAANDTANIAVSLNSTPGEGLTGPLSVTVTGPDASTVTSSGVPLTETPEVISLAQIELANAQSGGTTINGYNYNFAPVLVVIPPIGQETVFIEGTQGDNALGGIILQGNANLTLNDVDGTDNTVYIVGNGTETINIYSTSADNYVGGTGPTNFIVNPDQPTESYFFDKSINGGSSGHNTLTVDSAADFADGAITDIQLIVLNTNGDVVFNTDELQSPGDAIPIDASNGNGTLEIAYEEGSRSNNIIDLTGDLTGVTSLTVDSGVTVILNNASDFTPLTSIITIGSGHVQTTVAGGEALLGLGLSTTPNYVVEDTAANITAAFSADPAVLADSVGVVVTGTLTPDQAVQLYDLLNPAGINVSYVVSDTPAAIASALTFDTVANALVGNAGSSESYTGTATLAVAEQLQAEQKDGSGLLGFFTVSDTAANIANALLNSTLTPSDISGFQLSGAVSVAQANELVTIASNNGIGLTGSFTISDTLSNILANLQSATLAAATNVSLSAAGNVGTVAQIQAVEAELGHKFTGGYNLSDTVANLIAHSAIDKGASNINVSNGPIGVAVAHTIVGLGTSGVTTYSYTLQDNAANLAAAGNTVLGDATSITVTGSINVQQAITVTTASAYIQDYVLVDTGANLINAPHNVIQLASTIDATTPVTFAQALQLWDDKGVNATYTISDTAADLNAAVSIGGYNGSTNQFVLNHATTVTISNPATVLQAEDIVAASITHLQPYTISDTVADVVAASTNGAVTGATSVAATGLSTVAQALTLTGMANFNGVYSISDTAVNVANDVTGDDSVLQGSAAPVVLTGYVDVAQAAALVASITASPTPFTNWSQSYSLLDNANSLENASASVLSHASLIVMEDTAANIGAIGAQTFLVAHGNHWIVQDSIVDILLVAGVLNQEATITGAQQVIVTDAGITAAAAETLYLLNTHSVYAIADTAADLSGTNLTTDSAAVGNATSVTVTDTATVAQIAALDVVNPNVIYSLTDTAANLAAAGAAAIVADATAQFVFRGVSYAVTVTGTATGAQADTIIGLNTSAFYQVSDTTAGVQNASSPSSSAGIDGATPVLDRHGNVITAAVTLTDGDRIVATAAEVAHYTETGGVLKYWASAAPGVASTNVYYDLADTMANLATLTAQQLQDAGIGAAAPTPVETAVTALAGGAAVTAAQAVFVTTNAGTTAGNGPSFSGSYAISDTYANLEASGATITALEHAASVTVTDSYISAAQATTVHNQNAHSTFVIEDNSADLTNGVNTAAVHVASSVIITNSTTVATVESIEANNPHVTSYSLTDSAADLAGAPAALVADANSVTITGFATVAQLTTIDNDRGQYLNPANGIYDTAANVAGASQAVLNGSILLDVYDNATAAQGAVLETLTYDGGSAVVTYALADSATNILAYPSSVLHATDVTVTFPATAAQADVLATMTDYLGTHVQYPVQDTSANLLSLANIAAWSAASGYATIVIVTDVVNISVAAELYANNSSDVVYSVASSADHIAQGLAQLGGGITGIDLNQVLGSAQSVQITGGEFVDLTNYGGSYIVDGTIAYLTSLPAEIINANGYFINDSIANELANLSLTTAAKGYDITDSAGDIIAAAPSFVQGAQHIFVTDATITYAQAAGGLNSIYAVNGSNLADVSFNLSDTAANLFTNGNLNPGAADAGTITVTTPVTVADANSLLAQHSSGNSYAITDTVANLFSGGAVIGADYTSVAEATSVTVVGAITDADAYSLVHTHTSGPNFYSVTDTAANLFSGNTLKSEVVGAQSVTVTTAVNVAQAEALLAQVNKFTGTYALADSPANLAGASSALLQGASSVTETSDATVAQETTIQSLLAGHNAHAYTISDTLADISGASQTLLTGSSGLVTSGSATAAQAELLQALTYGSGHTPITYTVTDTAADILMAAYAAGIASSHDTSVTVTDASITVATAAAIHALNTAATDHYALADTSVNVELASTALLNAASSTTVTDTINVATAHFISSLPGNFIFANVTDTFANLDSANGMAALGHATSVHEAAGDTTDTVANVETFFEPGFHHPSLAVYDITDSATNILTAYFDQDHTAEITGATAVDVTGNTNVANASVLATLDTGGHTVTFANITDTIANVANAAPAVLNLAQSLTATAHDNNGGTAQAFNDLALTPSAELIFTHGTGGGYETIPAPSGGAFSGLLGVDVLTLKLGDSVDLSGYNITAPTATTTAALATEGNALAIQGFATAGGFTASASGSSTLLLWDPGTGVGGANHEAGVVLVGIAGAALDLTDAHPGTATQLHILLV